MSSIVPEAPTGRFFRKWPRCHLRTGGQNQASGGITLARCLKAAASFSERSDRRRRGNDVETNAVFSGYSTLPTRLGSRQLSLLFSSFVAGLLPTHSFLTRHGLGVCVPPGRALLPCPAQDPFVGSLSNGETYLLSGVLNFSAGVGALIQRVAVFTVVLVPLLRHPPSD